MNENCRNPKVRAEIKKRLEAELSMSDVPLHRKHEIESALYEISCCKKPDEKPDNVESVCENKGENVREKKRKSVMYAWGQSA